MDAHRLLQQSTEFIKGVGAARSALLARELDIHTWEDVLYHFPFRYIDRRTFQNVDRSRLMHYWLPTRLPPFTAVPHRLDRWERKFDG